MSTITFDIPKLETERLILRAHREDDFEAMVAIWTDPVVHRYFHGPLPTREEIWSKFLRQFGMWAVRGYGMFAVEEKESRAYVGMVGIFEVKRDIAFPVEDLPEAGWTLARRVHGQGYASEAMTAVLAWSDAKFGPLDMFCIVAPANRASIRVAEKCGFVPWCETTYKNEPTLVFRRRPNTCICV